MASHQTCLLAPCLTLPLAGAGRLHLAANVETTWNCRHRRDHRSSAAGTIAAALRLPGTAAQLRQLLLDTGCAYDAHRLSDAEVGDKVQTLVATGRLVAVQCGQPRKAPTDRLPPRSVPLHLGVAGTDFDGCWHHRCHLMLDLTAIDLALEVVQRFAGTPALRRAVRLATGGKNGIDDETAARLAPELLLTKQLCVAMCPMPKGPAARIAPAPAPARRAAPASNGHVVAPRQRELAKTWLEVHLVRSRDRAPVAGAHYRVELADGSLRHGRSDDRGIIYEKDVEAGTCKLALLDYDRNEWRRI